MVSAIAGSRGRCGLATAIYGAIRSESGRGGAAAPSSLLGIHHAHTMTRQQTVSFVFVFHNKYFVHKTWSPICHSDNDSGSSLGYR